MFSLTIAFGPAGGAWRLLYQDETKAKQAFDLVTGDAQTVTLVDEFGQHAFVKLFTVHAAMLENMKLSQLANIELALHQARTQAKGEEMAQSDQVLKSASFRRGSPAIVNPMGGMIPGNGRFPS